jgi:hypothetical protein
MLRQCADSPVLAMPLAGGGRGGLMICADRQAGDPVTAGDAAAGAGQLVVPDDGGTVGAGDKAAAPRALQARKVIN